MRGRGRKHIEGRWDSNKKSISGAAFPVRAAKDVVCGSSVKKGAAWAAAPRRLALRMGHPDSGFLGGGGLILVATQ